MHKTELKKLKEQMKTKERDYDSKILDLTRRSTIVKQQRDKMMRRPPDIVESSDSETSSPSEEEKDSEKQKQAKNLKEMLKNKKKVGRNDMLNLPSSEDEKVVVSYRM